MSGLASDDPSAISDGPSTAPRATAVIVTYNSRSTIGATLAAAAQCHAAGLLDVVVVDNESSDGTAASVRQEFPWVTVVDAGGNLGFARGCNLGFECAHGEFVILLNPDAALPVDALVELLAFFDRNRSASMAAPAIREPDGGLQHAGGLTTPGTILRSASGRAMPDGVFRAIEPGAPPFRTDWLCGAILMIRRTAYEQLDGFDPRYFLYFDETDLCRRAVDAGMELWAIGEAVGLHKGSASAKQEGKRLVSSCIPEHFYRSRFYYLRKFFGLPWAVGTELAELALIVLRAVARLVRMRPRDGRLAARLAGPILRTPAQVNAARPSQLRGGER